jgi:ketosteroid isomerase-like protein
MKKYSPFITLLTIVLIAAALYMYCGKKDETMLTQKEQAKVQQDVSKMADDIAHDITKDGPSAWLRYFANTPDFFMAVNGQLAFANNDSATAFIQNVLPKIIHDITLQWNNIRIDPLTNDLAVMAADYKETITDAAGKQANNNGYFTAIAQKTEQGWKLRNLHWSMLSAK